MRQKQPHFFILALLCIFPLPLWAGSVQIEAGKMTLFQKEGRVEFFNSVHLVRETLKLDCDHLTAYYSDHKLTHADASGHVVIVQNDVHGHAKKAHLDQLHGTLTLIGAATLEQKGSRIEGETIVHDLNAEKTVVTPIKGGRIHMRIESEDQDRSILPGAAAQ